MGLGWGLDVDGVKPTQHEIYLFGPWRLDAPGRRLSRAGESLALPPKAFELLLLLVRNAGRAVPRAELIDALWPNTVVEEGNLAWNVKELRRLLGPEGAEAITTVRSYGYRLALEVEREGAAPISQPPARRRLSPLLAASLVGGLLLLSWLALWPREGASRTTLESGLLSAQALSRAGDHTASFAELDRLAALPEPLGNDPRIELQRGRTARQAGDAAAARAAGARAEAAGRRTGNARLIAEALLLAAWADQALGEIEPGLKACEEGAAVAREVGARELEASHRALCAWMKLRAGDPAAAEVGFRSALALAHQAGSLDLAAESSNGLALLALERGRLREGAELAAEALAAAQQSGVVEQEISAQRTLALSARLRLDLEAAERHARAGLTAARALRLYARAAVLETELGFVLLERGDAEGAGATFAEVAQSAPSSTAASRAINLVSQGWVRLVAGDAAGAITLAESVIAEASSGAGNELTEAYALLAEAAAVAGRRAAAERAADYLAGAGLDRVTIFQVGWLLARAHALIALGRAEEATKILRELLTRPEWSELAGAHLEAELRLAELAARDNPAHRADLERLRQKARNAKLGRLLGERL